MAKKGKFQKKRSWFPFLKKKTKKKRPKPIPEPTPAPPAPVAAAPVPEPTPVSLRTSPRSGVAISPPEEAAPPEKPRSLLGKIWDVIKTVFTYLIMALAIAMMLFTAISMTTVGRADRNLFGYRAYIVRSDSMSATDFSAGDLAVVREVDPYTLQPGDIISFLSEDPETRGETFTHKIRALTTAANGAPAFITYGTTTGVDDLYPVTHPNVLGKYQFAVPKLGTFFAFMKTTPGYICCIFLPFVLLLVIQGGSSVNLARQMYKEKQEAAKAEHQAQMDALAAQQAAVEAQMKQMQQMMEELKALRSDPQ